MKTLYRTTTGINLELVTTRRERYYDSRGNRVEGIVAYLRSTCGFYQQCCEVERLGSDFETIREAA